MFVGFIIIMLFLLLGILTGIYSVFFPFMENVGNVTEFNSAYYGALGAVERAELALRYKEPGFEGSGGFIGTTAIGPVSDTISSGFGLLTSSSNGLTWSITSRTTTLPSQGNGNVDSLLSDTTSKDFYKLPYFSKEGVILKLDSTKNPTNYYTDTTAFDYFSGEEFSGILRLPPKVVGLFGLPAESRLCDNLATPSCDPDGDGIADDSVVNREVKGLSGDVSFSILPLLDVVAGIPTTDKDTSIRESFINNYGGLAFGAQDFSPLSQPTTLTKHNLVSKDSSLETVSWHDILSSTNITDLELSLQMVNLLRSVGGSIYPFLEYQFSFPQAVADRFFTVEGDGLVGNYHVKILIKKSTIKNNSMGDFAVIF